jgi:hypothetical protein
MTVSAMSYPHHVNHTRSPVTKPSGQMYLAGGDNVKQSLGQSETKRAFVPPEVMTFGKGMDVPRRDGIYDDLMAARSRTSVRV